MPLVHVEVSKQYRSICMYTMWPGCYSFRDELGIFALWLKEQADFLIAKIYELDRLLNS